MFTEPRPRLARALDYLALVQLGAGLAGVGIFAGLVFWSFTR